MTDPDNPNGLPLALRLLGSLLPREIRDGALADALEEYEHRRQRRGRLSALVWCWRQCVSPDLLRLTMEYPSRRRKAFMTDPVSLRQSLRTLAKRPLFSAAVVAILGLGIGATTAMFSVVKGSLLTPLPYPEADRIVRIAKNDTVRVWSHYPVLYPELALWRDGSESLEAVAALRYTGPGNAAITVDGTHRPVRMLAVTSNYFDVLGVPALLGRTFVPEEEGVEDSPSVVLSHGAWQRLFASDPDIVGKGYGAPGGGTTYRVVGVLPPGTDYPPGTEIYVPEMALGEKGREQIFEADVLARLAPGVSAEAVRAELQTLRAPLTLENPAKYGESQIVVTPLLETVVGDVRFALWLLFGAVSGVLLIASANVAGLLFVRGAERDRELAIRIAMGAGKARLTTQLLSETLLLALLGGGLGVLFARGAVTTLLALLPEALPRAERIGLDGTVLGFALGVSLLAALAAGLWPAWRASSRDAMTILRRGRGVLSDWRTMSAVVAFELSLAFVLVVAAGLLGRAFLAQAEIDRGFDPERLTFASLQIPGNKYPMFGDVRPRIDLMDRLIERAQAIPGVSAATVVQQPPGSADAGVTGPLGVEGQTEEERVRNPMVNIEWVPENLFEVLGMTLLRGRGFLPEDRGMARRVAIVSEAFAAHHWPGDDPIGKRIGFDRMPEVTVVGVIANVRYRELRKSWLDVYFPVGQMFEAEPERSYYGGRALVLRSSRDPASLASSVRAAIEEVDADIAVESVGPIDVILDAEVARPRFQALMLALFAGVGLLLAAVGIYGVMATLTTARSAEVGLRLALGATPSDAVSLLWKRGAAISAAGIGVGVLVAGATTRFLSSLLYGVSPLDPGSFAGSAIVLTAVALLAAYLPARRAARIDPASTLRQE